MLRTVLAAGAVLLSSAAVFAQGVPSGPSGVPIGPLAIPLIAVGAAGYGVYRLIKRKK
ncbi:hypothetical protein J7K18_00405 [bacterium]|nr:hypothetical protein [bacterium]